MGEKFANCATAFTSCRGSSYFCRLCMQCACSAASTGANPPYQRHDPTVPQACSSFCASFVPVKLAHVLRRHPPEPDQMNVQTISSYLCVAGSGAPKIGKLEAGTEEASNASLWVAAYP